MSGELVTVNGKPVDRIGLSDEGYALTTDVHISGIPVLRPPKAQRVIATRRGKAARRRANSRVMVSREYGVLNPPWER